MHLRQALTFTAVLLLTGCCDPHVIGNAVCHARRGLAEFQRTGSTDRFMEHWRSVDAGPGMATSIATLEWALEHPADLDRFLAAVPEREREWLLCILSGQARDSGLDEELVSAFESDAGENVTRLVHFLRLEQDGDGQALSAACDAAHARLKATEASARRHPDADRSQ